MEIYRTEEEQVEAIKRWWRENYKAVLGGVLMGVALLWGLNSWRLSQRHAQEAAGVEYQAMLQLMDRGRWEEAAQHGQRLLGRYGDTGYAPLAALAMAKVKLAQEDADAALSHLRLAVSEAGDEATAALARLRLAQLLAHRGRHDEALAALAQPHPQAMASLYEETRGDVLAAQGRADAAREAYEAALAAAGPEPGRRGLLQMKRDDLGAPTP